MTLRLHLEALSMLKRLGDEAVTRHDHLFNITKQNGDALALEKGLVDAHAALLDVLGELGKRTAKAAASPSTSNH